MEASDNLKSYIKDGLIKSIEKASLISKAPSSSEDMLINACVNKASLKELKTLLAHKKKSTVVIKQETRGRSLTRSVLEQLKKLRLQNCY